MASIVFVCCSLLLRFECVRECLPAGSGSSFSFPFFFLLRRVIAARRPLRLLRQPHPPTHQQHRSSSSSPAPAARSSHPHPPRPQSARSHPASRPPPSLRLAVVCSSQSSAAAAMGLAFSKFWSRMFGKVAAHTQQRTREQRLIASVQRWRRCRSHFHRAGLSVRPVTPR